jgi:hypothetical protein
MGSDQPTSSQVMFMQMLIPKIAKTHSPRLWHFVARGAGMCAARCRKMSENVVPKKDSKLRSKAYKIVIILRHPSVGLRCPFRSGPARRAFQSERSCTLRLPRNVAICCAQPARNVPPQPFDRPSVNKPLGSGLALMQRSRATPKTYAKGCAQHQLRGRAWLRAARFWYRPTFHVERALARQPLPPDSKGGTMPAPTLQGTRTCEAQS